MGALIEVSARNVIRLLAIAGLSWYPAAMKTSACSFLTLLLVAGGILRCALCQSQAAEQLVGGYSVASTTNNEVIAAAQFAVKAQALSVERGAAISVVEILEARQQVVAGMNYRLRLKAKVDGTDKEADVVVWRKLNGAHKLTSWAWKVPGQAVSNAVPQPTP
jgi:hypothetical protein